MILDGADPLAQRLFAAIQGGEGGALTQLIADHEGIASAQVRDRRGGLRSALHIVTDWPGYFPRGPEIAALLLAAGADPGGGVEPGQGETPLHWAASSDDHEVAIVLLDGGADIEARGAVIGGGTPLADAVAFGCWNVAHELVRRGAQVEWLWMAAGLGLRGRVDELIAEAGGTLVQTDLDHAFWQACHGGQRRMAEHLADLGADVNAHPDHNDSPPLQIAASGGTQRDQLVEWLRARGAV